MSLAPLRLWRFVLRVAIREAMQQQLGRVFDQREDEGLDERPAEAQIIPIGAGLRRASSVAEPLAATHTGIVIELGARRHGRAG